MLKSSENPKRAPTQIQYQYSSVNILLALRRAFPTVGSGTLGSKFGCNGSLEIFDFNHIYRKSHA
jgi:hypothetical protein